MAREHLFPKVRAGSDRPSLSDVPVFKLVTMAWVTVQLEVGGVVCLPHYSTRAESGGAVVLGRKSRFCSQKGMLGWPRTQEQEWWQRQGLGTYQGHGGHVGEEGPLETVESDCSFHR